MQVAGRRQKKHRAKSTHAFTLLLRIDRLAQMAFGSGYIDQRHGKLKNESNYVTNIRLENY